MSDQEKQLLQSIEDAYFLLPTDGKRVRAYNCGDVTGRISSFLHNDFNLVHCRPGLDALQEKNLKRVVDDFAAAGVPFSFMVTPLSPLDLRAQLERAGFFLHEIDYGMVLDADRDVTQPIDGVRVEQLAEDCWEEWASVLAESFRDKTSLKQYIAGLYWQYGSSLEFMHYVAWLEEVDHPVGAAMVLRIPRSDIWLMEIAGVLPGWRKRGVYKALLHRRLKDARQRGMRSAIIQAIHDTSAPVAETIGFRKVAEHQFWCKKPE